MAVRSYDKSNELLARAKKVLAGGVSSEFRKYSYPHPLFYTHGNGSKVYDVDGNEYVDFTLSQGPLILGHSHPEVVEAVNQYSTGGQLFAGQHLQELELAEKICGIIKSADLIRFCLDGSEAIQTALRIARAKTGKQKFLRFEGHYHGWLDNVCWGTAIPPNATTGSREEPVVYPWSEGVAATSRNEVLVIPWNDEYLLKKTIAENANDIAAVITEPVMCNNGCILPNDKYLQLIRTLCNGHNIAFILDEVITGFRLGLGGAQAHFDIEPDISIFAKAIASGYPISVVAGRYDWMKLVEEGRVIHAGTMNSGNASVAAALATISVLERERPYERLFSMGQRFIGALSDAAKEAGHDDVLIQGPGPMFNISFTLLKKISDYRDTLKSDKVKLSKFIAGMHDEGVRIIGRGLIYISMAHSDHDIDFAIEKARKVFASM